MKLTKITAVAATVAAVLTTPTPAQAPAPVATTASSYKLPAFMDGEKTGASDGNPVAVGGKPLWRLDEVWPDNILQRANFKPMTWGGQVWNAPDHKFGGATAKIENSNITLGTRAAWGATGDEAGSKLNALVFIAPAAGHYSLAGTARAGVWQGDGAVSLHVLKSDGQTMTRLKSIPLPKDQDVPLDGVEADLAAGQELFLTEQIGAWYTGVNLELKNLRITSGGVGPTVGASGALTPGSLVSIGGHQFKVELAEGKIVVLRQQD